MYSTYKLTDHQVKQEDFVSYLQNIDATALYNLCFDYLTDDNFEKFSNHFNAQYSEH